MRQSVDIHVQGPGWLFYSSFIQYSLSTGAGLPGVSVPFYYYRYLLILLLLLLLVNIAWHSQSIPI